MTRTAVAIAATLALAATAFAADAPKQQPQQPASDVPKLVETIDVRVINVDVVVLDRKGKHVPGLTKDDFEILENGKAKAISNFYEVESHPNTPPAPQTAGAQPAVPAQTVREEIPENQKRRIIFYVDNLSLMPFNRNRVFKEMKEFAKQVLRPGDEAMVATFNRSLKVRAAFTRDPVQIQQTLDTIAGESALGVSNKSEARDVMNRIQDASSIDDATATARTYAESVEHDLRQSVTSLTGLMTTLAGVEGKKIVVLTTEGFQMQPGREMFTLIDEVAHQKGWQGSTMLEGMSFNNAPLIQSIAKTANANGITLYAIHAAGLGASNDNLMADQSKSISYNVSQSAVSNVTESLQLMTELTGGVASINTNNFAKAFQTIQSDLDSYYSLGYRGGTERVDRQRNLEVRLKNNPKGYQVRSRQSFVEKSTFAEMSDRVVANLLYRTKANDLKIAVRTNSPVPQDDGLFSVPVEIQIPMDSLTLLPQGDIYAGGFSIYVAVANKDGDMSDVAHKTHQINVPASEAGKIKGKYYTYSLSLLMEPGLNKISIGVVDDVSNTTGFAKDQVIAQDMR